MRCATLSVLTALIAGADGFRARQRRKGTAKSASKGISKAAPEIAGLYPFGSPGATKPPMKNARGGPCFPGARFWTARAPWADFATTVTGVLGYRHPYVDGIEINLKDDSTVLTRCDSKDSDTPNMPRGLPKELHAFEIYIAGSQNLSALMYDMGNVGVRESFTMEREEATKNAAKYGWELAGSAVDDGGLVYVGRQVSHLFQQPATKECILTFQGSSSKQDWAANAMAKSVRFCGLEEKAHKGFRDALRYIVKNEAWQSDVKPKLSTCSKVYVTGHSMGGAQAELFAGCVQRAPLPGEEGYESDYQFMAW